MKRKGWIWMLMIILAGMTLSGCAAGGKQEDRPSSLILATGGTAGTYYPLGGGMANVIKEKAGVNTTAQVTGASVENMRLLSKKEVDLAFTQSDIADYAHKGIEMFKDSKVDNLNAIGGLYLETVQIVVAEGSSIQSVSELKGKKVSVGSPGSGTEANARQILEAYGITFDDMGTERLSFGDSAKKIQDGQLDAAFITAGAPTAAVNELAATKGVRILTLDKEGVKKLIDKYPFYVEQTIAASTYPKQDAEVTTVAVKAVLTVRAELAEGLVYDMTKALYENTDALVAINTKAKEMKAEDAVKGISIPLHPGALKYYKEKGYVN
ncbi:TAXI family TRAP transporter solute-binding subunit [Paenibacillus sp. YYML68]|uniref:TAXI family TRAP transporter solute-binding subunit n=1 Tax=Paenibacillus sp. YYML68 TaxID=2909250 RepID=UPI0024912381|nr:TAXI family TRAP transporter solute-binding subunit [Paenibacillus sp. YYML68]